MMKEILRGGPPPVPSECEGLRTTASLSDPSLRSG
jgi:hypothetical protein